MRGKPSNVVLWCHVFALPLAVALTGCGPGSGGGTVPEEEQVSRYALDVKTQTLDYVENPSPELLQGLIELVEVHESKETGEHGETYAQILSVVRELKESGSGQELAEAQAEKLTSLAEKLPGDVSARQEEMQEGGGTIDR